METKTMTNGTDCIETFLPVFRGYYCTVEGQMLDDAYEREIEYMLSEGYMSKEGYEKVWFKFDWKKMHDLVAKVAVEVFNDKIKEFCGIESFYEFDKVWSPSSYNYVNDEIHVKVKREDYECLCKAVPKLAECGWTVESSDNESTYCANIAKAVFEVSSKGCYADEVFIWDIEERLSSCGMLENAVWEQFKELGVIKE